MLYRELLTDALRQQRDDFLRFAKLQDHDAREYLRILDRLSKHSSAEVINEIGTSEDIGAIPSIELDAQDRFSIDFPEKWQNHEQARRWADGVLKNRTTFAADASQFMPGRDITLPVAAIQVGWFENPHDSAKAYEKNASFRLLSPGDLLENQEEPMNLESRVGEIRFCAEVDRTVEFLKKKIGWQARGERLPLAFFDGTLLVSYPLPQSALQTRYVKKILELVRLSAKTKVPVIGYVDHSYSRDLVSLLAAFDAKSGAGTKTLYDSAVLSAQAPNRVLEKWGDRTVFCYSKRKGLSEFIDHDTGSSLVGFSYLQTTGDGLPARIDVPAWIYEEGFFNEVADVVRAECVIGLGYPYPIETADSTAFIHAGDREIFLGALQEFANREKLNFSVSRKSASKGRRR